MMEGFVLVAVLFALVGFFVLFSSSNRERGLRAHWAYGGILELIDWEWMPSMDLFKKGEAKYGNKWPYDATVYKFLKVLEKDGKIESRREPVQISGERIINRLMIRKLSAPGGPDPSKD